MATTISDPFRVQVVTAPRTRLAQLAASMTQGQWTQMSPTPSGLTLFNATGSSGFITTYASKMGYDPAQRRIYFAGNDHFINPLKHVYYDEVTNAWNVVPDTVPAGWGTGVHGYDGNTAMNGKHYVALAGRGIWSWSPSTGHVNEFPNLRDVFGYATTVGFDAHLARGTIIIAQVTSGSNGRVGEFNPATGRVTLFPTILAGIGGLHCFCTYNPTSQVALFGAGDNGASTFSFKVWSIDTAGVVTARADVPYHTSSSPGGARCIPNLSSGGFITIKDSTQWHELPASGGTWSAKSGTPEVALPPTHQNRPWMHGIVSATVAQYGVIAFIKGRANGLTTMWLYKP